MKILLINYEFPPLGAGAGNATKNIARELAFLGHEVLVLTTWFSGCEEDHIVDGYRLVRLKSKRTRADRSNIIEMLDFAWKAIIQGRTIVKEFNPSMSISFFAIPSGIVAFYFKLKFKIPYIVSLRGGDVPGFLPTDLKWHHILSKPLTSLIWRNAMRIVANSEGLRNLANKTAVQYGKSVVMIPNGVDGKTFKPKQNGEYTDETRILSLGRLTEQKGITYILDALGKILQERSNLKGSIFFDIVGDGPLRESLEIQVKNLGLQDVVLFHGWASREKIPLFYQNADLFILPSSEEGMSNSMLEAMASGLPIITTQVSGCEELVKSGENGLLVQDRVNLVPTLTEFLDNREIWRTMGKRSLAMSKSFNWKQIAEDYINLTLR